MFGFIKKTIDSVIGGLVDFMDWIGLTDSKAAERAENDKKRAEEAKKQKDEELKKAQEVEKEKERLAKEAAEKEAQRMQKIRDDQKSLNDFLKSEREKRHQESLSEQDRELRQLQLSYDEKKKLAHGDAALLKALNEEYQKEIEKINTDYANKRAQEELAVAKKTNELLKQIKLENIAEEEALSQEIQNIRQGAQATELQDVQDVYHEKIERAKQLNLDFAVLEEELERKKKEINDKYNVQEVEQTKLTTEAKLQLAQMSLGSLSSLADALTANGVLNAKQSFKVNKSLQLAQAGIGAVQAVQAVLADPTLVGPARFIAAAAVGITGAANVAKIAAMKFNPGTTTPPPPPGTMGGGGGGGSTSAPALDLSFLNNGQTKAQPVQSYVLATNVTSAQDAQQKIIDQSKLIK
jgi:chemotaxis protein histidine kinase CheA